ncbi:MAG: rRNA maturation RNase YbeY [Bacteroidia bacterium]|nr:rRNA maturation RNase YbeY [Bacteroidia bacterium]
MIFYNTIDKQFVLKDKLKLKRWIFDSIEEEKENINYISFNFCSDEYILDLNNIALKHNYYTDIITFELNNKEESIEGDIYISIDRVKENAKSLKVSFINELHRVIIHGVLHLCGYKDKTIKDSRIMREKENYYLNKL